MAGARKAWNKRARAATGGKRLKAKDYTPLERRYAMSMGTYHGASHTYDSGRGGTATRFSDVIGRQRQVKGERRHMDRKAANRKKPDDARRVMRETTWF